MRGVCKTHGAYRNHHNESTALAFDETIATLPFNIPPQVILCQVIEEVNDKLTLTTTISG
jgi:hypothetical protein